jgi:hypothetical protein
LISWVQRLKGNGSTDFADFHRLKNAEKFAGEKILACPAKFRAAELLWRI